jgi:hypothetical protein
MMRDDILYGNILGLLRNGKWSMNSAEAVALIQIIQELDRRLKPPVISETVEPIKREKKHASK